MTVENYTRHWKDKSVAAIRSALGGAPDLLTSR